MVNGYNVDAKGVFVMPNDYAFFLDNISTLYKQYGDSFLAIKDGRILGAYKTLEDAVVETAKTHALGSFLVQQCVDNPESLVAHFAGNVA